MQSASDAVRKEKKKEPNRREAEAGGVRRGLTAKGERKRKKYRRKEHGGRGDRLRGQGVALI